MMNSCFCAMDEANSSVAEGYILKKGDKGNIVRWKKNIYWQIKMGTSLQYIESFKTYCSEIALVNLKS